MLTPTATKNSMKPSIFQQQLHIVVAIHNTKKLKIHLDWHNWHIHGDKSKIKNKAVDL